MLNGVDDVRLTDEKKKEAVRQSLNASLDGSFPAQGRF